MKRQHLLPLTNYLVNGQYAIVQPIASKFAERCIYYLLTTNCGREKAVSAAANKKCRQWNVRQVLSIDGIFMSVLWVVWVAWVAWVVWVVRVDWVV